MKLAGAFFRLIRYPNLFFIALTQFLFYYCVILPSFRGAGPDRLGVQGLILLVLASVFIAAAGYIINDYFDLNIDRVNKPARLVVDQLIRRRWAILWHLGFSAAGVILSMIVSARVGNPMVGILNLVTVFLLWFYSTSFKKQALIGNVIISLLTAWVVLVLLLAVSPVKLDSFFNEVDAAVQRTYKFAVLYGSFAFIISLVREVVKDIEDMDGDARYGCRTMPIVWGIPASKMFAAVWMVVLICSLVILQVYALQLGWWWSALYSTLLVILPMILILRRLIRAVNTKDFRELSTLIKLVMLTGILSMLFIRFYS